MHQKTILDFLDISEKERDYIWNSFECLRFADLDIPADEWDRLRSRYCIYQEDFLEDILALSIGYIYEIWHDKTRFNEILNSVFGWVESALGYDVSFIPDVIKELSAMAREDVWMAVYNSYKWIYFPMKLGIKKYIWIAVYNNIDDSYNAERVKAKSQEAHTLTASIQDKFKQIFKTEHNKGIVKIGRKRSKSLTTAATKHNKDIMKMRATGSTLESAGQKYRLSRERVRQVEQKVLDKFNSFLLRKKPHYILQTFTQRNTLLSVDDIQHHLGELSEIFIYCLKKCNNKAVLWSDALNGFIIGDSSWCITVN
ncbi:MAG: hypothetical protein CVU88_07120 [Firmicutes bacterium HGW-Firmicutes-13]|nr:MAG: hypothetical protein CVU88_07120 [Firmicutes bacterium HGW-Firmicutes-13]